MIIIDLIVLWIVIKIGFKIIKKLNKSFPILPVKLFKYLLLYHLFFSFVYCMLSKVKEADSIAYYFGSRFELKMGTAFIDSITFILSDILHLSYLSTFWIFGLIGFFWLPIMYISICENMVISKRILQIFHCILFLPGINFYTSNIGKDGIMALGITSLMLSLNRISNRKKWFFFGLFLMFMIRPHICAVALLALAISLLIHRSFFKSKFVLILTFLGILLGPVLIFKIFDYLKVSISSLSELLFLFEIFQQFQEKWSAVNLRGGSAVDISDYSFFFKMFTFLYRPLFIDANNKLMFLYSFENLSYLIMTLFIFHRYVIGFFMKKKSLFFTFNFIYFLMTTTFFSLIITNLGLASRMRIMILPSLISIILISQSYNRWVINKKKVILNE